MGTRRTPRDQGELHRRVGELLELEAIDGPEEWPLYVKAPTVPGEAAGWWWRPAGAEHREYLGHNVFHALRALEVKAGRRAA